MQASRRQSDILHQVRLSGSCAISELAGRLGVSSETIRRNIQPLVEGGQLHRVRGGVVLPDRVQEAPFQRRLAERGEAKRRIADAVAGMIRDGESLMLDTGSTTAYVAQALSAHSELTVVTNCTEIARTLAHRNGNRVFIAGGELRADDAAVFGPSAIDFVSQFQVQRAVLSIGAVSAALDFMDYHLCEAEFSRAVIQQAQQIIIVADGSKFGRQGLIRVCGPDAVDRLVTDQSLDARYVEGLSVADVQICIAG